MKKVIFTLMFLLTAVFSYAADAFAGLNKVNVWTGTHEVNWNASLDLSASAFATAQVGDKVAFTVEKVGADAEIFMQDESWNNVDDMTIKPIATTATVVSFDVTETALQALQAATHIKGQNVTITSIDLYQQAEVKEYNSTVIYDGDPVVFGNWNNFLKIASDKFMDAKAGDKIKINFKDVEAGAQIQVNNGTFGNAYVEYDAIAGTSYEYVMDEESATDFQENGAAFKGQKATIVSVELLLAKSEGGEGGGVATLNEIDVKSDAPKTFKGATNWQDWITIPGSGFADAMVGDKVKFYIETVGETPQLQINDNSWASIFASKPQVNVSGDSYTFKIEDEDMLTKLQAGLFIKGQNVTVTKVTLLTQAAVKNFTSSVIYEGPVVALAKWKNWVEVPAAGFATAKVGDKIKVNFTDIKEDAQLQLAAMIVGWDTFLEYDNIVGTSYEYVLNDENVIAELKEFGLAIKGQNASVESVELLSLQTTSGISELTSDKKFGENQPVEIFDLTGKRLSNMNGHGIYLLRQGNKTVKVAK